MTARLEYKGYDGSIDVDLDGGVIAGRIMFIRDHIAYSSDTVGGIRQAFEEAVDDYLAMCASLGEQPQQPCKGSFNVRVGPALHRAASIAAMHREVSLNDLVCQALRSFLGEGKPAPVTVVETHNHTTHITANITSVSAPVTTSTRSQPMQAIAHGNTSLRH
jgi:predicted HicB family RNase H-like nuclease